MKIDLKTLFTKLGLNIGLIAVLVAVLSLFGVSLDVVLTIVESMVGLQLLIMLTINVLKWAGAVNDGTAGKWSAALNLVGIGIIATILGLNPSFDFSSLDAQLVDIAKFLTLLFGYIVQIAGTKYFHQTVTQGLGVNMFSNTRA